MDGHATSEQHEPELDWLPKPGEVVAGKYVVETVLGHGGMGVVIAAKHQQLGHRVAIKYLRPDLGRDGDAVARFTREAQAAVALRGEHVARVQDVGTLDSGAPYMIMELLTGVDLETLVEREGALPIEHAVEFVLQACEALAEAHALGIVHRDIKPSNLCLTERPDGSPLIKVLDFGIAKALDPAPDQPRNLTATGVALGTPLYMSPEQIRDTKAADRRTDIWALGAVLHQLLSSQPPFAADTLPALCAKVVTDPPDSLQSLRADVPEGLSRVVLRCLEKAPEDRYRDVAELAEALGPFAPDRAAVHVERVGRIVAGKSASAGAGVSDSGRWLQVDASAATEAAGLPASPAEAKNQASSVDAAAPMREQPQPVNTSAPDAPQQTAAAWHTEADRTGDPGRGTSKRTTTARLGALALVGALVVVVVVWIASWGSAPEPRPARTLAAETAAPASGAVSAASMPEPSGGASATQDDGAALQASAQPTATAISTVAAAPRPAPRRTVATRPTASSTAKAPASSHPKHDSALSDRK